jgi:hypothetical protein
MHAAWPTGMAESMTMTTIREILKFRMGSHDLSRDSDSWAGIPRLDRVCRFCGAGSMGDGKILLFECPHLQFNRNKFSG